MQKVVTGARGMLLQLHLTRRVQEGQRMELTFQVARSRGRYKKRNHILYYAPCTKEIGPVQSAGEKRFTQSL